MTARDQYVEIIGHRGSSYLAPENTLAAFKLGWQETTTCELDIHRTLDGRLAVIHDDSTKRTASANFKVADHSLGELQKLDAGSFKGVRWRGEKIPSLEEVIAAMPTDKRLLIEIKTGPEAVPELARVIRVSGKAKQMLIHSFYPPACAAARKAFPRIPVYLLIKSRQNLLTGAWAYTVDEAIAVSRELGLDGIGANNTPLVNATAMQKVHANGLKLNLWTVDRVNEAKKMIALGVDGIITNRPGWLKAQLAKSPPLSSNARGGGSS
jgi:glycerophosphoryl diester phosphodiesterase